MSYKGLRWRASYWFVTFVVGLGITTDLVVYSIVIPVLPFRLQQLNYHGVSALVGWLLFAYSAGLVVATIPTAMFSERYNNRKIPLFVGILGLLGSQVMLMLAPAYWVMVLARILQGISSSMVWVVGLALLCDVTPKDCVGRQLGFAMLGVPFGTILGPPIGGALYSAFGFRGPFVFGLALSFLDLLGRILIIESKDLPSSVELVSGLTTGSVEVDNSNASQSDSGNDKEDVASRASHSDNGEDVVKAKALTLLQVISKLCRSGRAGNALLLTAVTALVFNSIDPTLPLHLQAVWGLNSSRVGVVFTAVLAPSLISSPVGGYCSDKYGAEWVSLLSILLSLPWWMLLIIQGKLAVFIVFFAFATLFSSALIPPVTAELAAAANTIEGIGYAHTYGAYNLVYGIGSAVGPIIGGQIYDHIHPHGWTAICSIATGSLLICIAPSIYYTGDRPLWQRIGRRRRGDDVVMTEVLSSV